MPRETKKMNSPPLEVPISDLGLASYLMALGYSLDRIEGPPYKSVFVFANVPEPVVLSFYREDALIHPRKILDSLRALKALTRRAERQ